MHQPIPAVRIILLLLRPPFIIAFDEHEVLQADLRFFRRLANHEVAYLTQEVPGGIYPDRPCAVLFKVRLIINAVTKHRCYYLVISWEPIFLVVLELLFIKFPQFFETTEHEFPNLLNLKALHRQLLIKLTSNTNRREQFFAEIGFVGDPGLLLGAIESRPLDVIVHV